MNINCIYFFLESIQTFYAQYLNELNKITINFGTLKQVIHQYCMQILSSTLKTSINLFSFFFLKQLFFKIDLYSIKTISNTCLNDKKTKICNYFFSNFFKNFLFIFFLFVLFCFFFWRGWIRSHFLSMWKLGGK